MRYSFKVHGHRNVRSTHPSTLEFTREKDLTTKGDCILGVRAEFEDFSLMEFIGRAKAVSSVLIFTLNHGNEGIKIYGHINEGFRSKGEMVLRQSTFRSERTIVIRATRAANEIPRTIVEHLMNPDNDITITVEPFVPKAVFLDFDDTIEDFTSARNVAEQKLADMMLRQYNIIPSTFKSEFSSIDESYSWKGSAPKYFDRHLWFTKLLRMHNITPTREEVDGWVRKYWELIYENANPFPNALEFLQTIKQRGMKLFIVTDSDGDRDVKQQRMKKILGDRLIDTIVTGDDVGRNKPNRLFYENILSEYNLKPEDCVMIGDRPKKDLEVAKEFGMMTVWMNPSGNGNRLDYVDLVIESFAEIEGFLT